VLGHCGQMDSIARAARRAFHVDLQLHAFHITCIRTTTYDTGSDTKSSSQVSASFVCGAEAITSERTGFKYESLNSSWRHKRRYQPLWHVIYMPLPVRESVSDTSVSSARWLKRGDTLRLVLDFLLIAIEANTQGSPSAAVADPPFSHP
jgi:hypothetical protein